MDLAGTIKALREELCTRGRQCVCGHWDDCPGPCCHHERVNAQLDVLDTLAIRSGLDIGSTVPANEPVISRGNDGTRAGAWPRLTNH